MELEYQHWGARLPLSARQGTVTTLALHRRTRTQRPSSSARVADVGESTKGRTVTVTVTKLLQHLDATQMSGL